jgi:hypothetical protein
MAGVGTAQAQATEPAPVIGAQPSPSQQTLEPTAAPSGEVTSAPPAAEQPPATEAAPLPDSAPLSAPDSAADDGSASAAGWGDLSEVQTDAAEEPIFRTKLYGFVDAHIEKVAKTPDSVSATGQTIRVRNPYELDIPNLNVMVLASIYDRYKVFLNLASPGSGSNIDDEPVVVRNAWVEAPIWRNYLAFRIGKTYRRFGLYNEILDAVPTFIGIEAPELFDKDHLMLTRTTNMMLHGSADLGQAVINYSLTTGNEERDDKAIPVGADVYIDLPFGIRLGTSFYHTGGSAVPSRGMGDGSPRGGVVNWMDHDKYMVYGGYAQLKHAGLILQTEFWQADHNAVRSAESVLQLADAGLNPAQQRRFFSDAELTQARTVAKYKVRAFYLRAGYEITLGERASITPYAQFDYYDNPETINNKDFGGDNEAGLTDNGEFEKYTAGLVMRPVSQVAFKADVSGHRQQFNGKSEFYPEFRLSLAYLWELSL